MTADFSHVKSFKHYVETIDESRDLKILSEYVLDEIFEHDGETEAIHIFKDLSLRKIREYNDLAIDVMCTMREEGKIFTTKLAVFQFMKQNSLPVGVLIPDDGDYGHTPASIADLPIKYYSYRDDKSHHGMELVSTGEFITSDEFKTHEEYRPKEDDDEYPIEPHRIEPIAIPRINDEFFYIDYFINHDSFLNRLRKLLITLMKEQMKLYSAEIDGGKQVANELEYNQLLIEYCRKLIHECELYLRNKESEPIPLTL